MGASGPGGKAGEAGGVAVGPGALCAERKSLWELFGYWCEDGKTLGALVGRVCGWGAFWRDGCIALVWGGGPG